ncbi:MAG: hypothetical protein AB7G93_07150 [Bdellovibrionales bacterium]
MKMTALMLIMTFSTAVANAEGVKELTCSDVIVRLDPDRDSNFKIKVISSEESGEVPQELGSRCFVEKFCSEPVSVEAKPLCDDIKTAKIQTDIVSAAQFQTLLRLDEVRSDLYKDRAQGQ